MKGKILSIITAVLFGATMVATPIVMAAGRIRLSGVLDARAVRHRDGARCRPEKIKSDRVPILHEPTVYIVTCTARAVHRTC